MLSQIVFPKKSNSFMLYLFYTKGDTHKFVFLRVDLHQITADFKSLTDFKSSADFKLSCTETICTEESTFQENVSNVNLLGCDNERINQ